VNELVSVIVPVYNVEKYLNQCIESLVNQSYKELEIILIDDGSTDKSGEICDFYHKKYKNIQVYHIDNNGVSNARNIGIKKSTGKYILFVDSDDYLNKYMIDKMVKKMVNCDMVSVGYAYCYKDKTIDGMNIKSGLCDKERTKYELFQTDSINGFTPNKMFKRSIIINNKLEFNTKIKICEDLLFCFEYVNNIDSSYIIDESLYNYRMRKTSATNRINPNELSIFYAYEIMSKIDEKVYSYNYNSYAYMYYKYKKNLSKNNNFKIEKISFYKMLFSTKIAINTKTKIIGFMILPRFIKNRIVKFKQKKYNYYE